jgi:hypothetical protein
MSHLNLTRRDPAGELEGVHPAPPLGHAKYAAFGSSPLIFNEEVECEKLQRNRPVLSSRPVQDHDESRGGPVAGPAVRPEEDPLRPRHGACVRPFGYRTASGATVRSVASHGQRGPACASPTPGPRS